MISSNFNRRRRSRTLPWALLLLALLLIAGAVVWRAPLQGLFYAAMTPLLHARFGRAEPQPAASALQATIDMLVRENTELKSRLSRQSGVQTTLAGVLMRPPATPYDTLLIDAGAAEGVAQGQFVAASGRALIGSVSEVFAHSARVTLYSSPGQKYDGVLHLQEGGSLPLTVLGQGGGSLFAQVPAKTRVAVGDQVSIGGVLGGVTSAVKAIERGAGESFATLYLQLPQDPATLEFVEVWKR